MIATARRRTQEQRRTEAEDALIQAAAELIAQGGSAAVTLAKVGERAGYSRGLANHHFGNKARLMERVVETVTESFRRSISSLPPESSLRCRLASLIDSYFVAVQSLQPINRARLILIAEAMADEFEFREAILEGDRIFRSALTEAFGCGMTSGELPQDTDPEGLAIATVALLRGVALQFFADTGMDIDKARIEVEQLLYGRLEISPS